MKKARVIRTPQTLPDDLVTEILAKMPFPSIFKVPCLSKAWFANFLPLSALHDEESKLLAASFQSEVRERVRSLGPFFPICVDKQSRTIAYSWATQNWVRFPSLSFLPKDWQYSAVNTASSGSSLDPWLVVVTFDMGPGKFDMYFHVANIFTRCWKSVPPHPGCSIDWNREIFAYHPKVVRDSSSGAYTLIVLSYKPQGGDEEGCIWVASIFNFNTNAWSIFELGQGVAYRPQYAYLNGVVYMVAYPRVSTRLFTLNLEEGTSSILRLRCNDPPPQIDDLVACGGQLLMVCHVGFFGAVIRIMKVDLESQQLLVVNRGPPDSLTCLFDGPRTVFNIALQSHGNYIFFQKDYCFRGNLDWTHPVVAYDVLKDEWSRFHCSPVPAITVDDESNVSSKFDAAVELKTNSRCRDLSFQPGSDPFWPL